MNSKTVIHDIEQQRFVLALEGAEVVLKYRRPGEHRMDMLSTYTPPELRGRGFARRVVEFALEYAKSNQLQVIPSCWYVEKIIREQEEQE